MCDFYSDRVSWGEDVLGGGLFLECDYDISYLRSKWMELCEYMCECFSLKDNET